MRFFIHFFFISILPPLALLVAAGDTTGQIEIGEKSPHHTPNVEQSIVSSGTVLSPAHQVANTTLYKHYAERLWPATLVLNRVFNQLLGTLPDARMEVKSNSSSIGTDGRKELANLLRHKTLQHSWFHPDDSPANSGCYRTPREVDPWMRPNIPSDFREALLAMNVTTLPVFEQLLEVPEEKLAEFMDEILTEMDAEIKLMMEKAEELTAIQNALQSLLVQQSEPVENKFSKLLERMPIVLKIVCAVSTLFYSVYSCCFKKRPSNIIESRTEVVVRQRR